MEGILIRHATETDFPALLKLYQAAAENGGLARNASEITQEYITEFVSKSRQNGLILVAYNPEYHSELLGELHGYILGPKIFSHVFENVTMAVHPAYQGKGIGRILLQNLQNIIEQHFSHFLKIELKCFSNNERALQLYLKNGFKIEGRQEKRVQLSPGIFADGLALGWFNPNYKYA